MLRMTIFIFQKWQLNYWSKSSHCCHQIGSSYISFIGETSTEHEIHQLSIPRSHPITNYRDVMYKKIKIKLKKKIKYEEAWGIIKENCAEKKERKTQGLRRTKNSHWTRGSSSFGQTIGSLNIGFRPTSKKETNPNRKKDP